MSIDKLTDITERILNAEPSRDSKISMKANTEERRRAIEEYIMRGKRDGHDMAEIRDMKTNAVVRIYLRSDFTMSWDNKGNLTVAYTDVQEVIERAKDMLSRIE